MNMIARTFLDTTIRAIPDGQKVEGHWYILQDVLNVIGYAENDLMVTAYLSPSPYVVANESVSLVHGLRLLPWLEGLNDTAKALARRLQAPSLTPETLPAVVYKNVRVVTTEVLAEMYEVKPQQILQNFNNNIERFDNETHYFKLTGEALKDFKELYISKHIDEIEELGISRRVSQMILWTERGARRHAKMLTSDRAWDVYEQMEDAYFSQVEAQNEATLREPKDPALAAIFRMLLTVDEVKQKVEVVETEQATIKRELEDVKLQHRGNVPPGHIGKKEAYDRYGVYQGQALSEEIFHTALRFTKVPTKDYTSISTDGFETRTFAYREEAIPPALDRFIAEAVRVNKSQCASPMAGMKRFRFMKPA
jgi:hypothetical protein